MSSISLKLRQLRPVRALLALCVCALVFFVSVLPAYAVTSSTSEGEDKMLNLERESMEVVGKDPAGMKEQTEKTKSGGLNVVQGDADKDKMITPEQAKAEGATSFEEQVKNVIDNITGK